MVNLGVNRTMRRVVGIPITRKSEDHPCRLFATACFVYAELPIKFRGPKGKCEKNIDINLTEICYGLDRMYRHIHRKSPSYVSFPFCERLIHVCTLLDITVETTSNIPARQAVSYFLYQSATTTRTSVSNNSLLSPYKDSAGIVLIRNSHFLACFNLTMTQKLQLLCVTNFPTNFYDVTGQYERSNIC
jgi:hypothetical protein